MPEAAPLPWWETHNSHKTCHYCNQPVARSRNSSTVGMCPEHRQIWSEDIEGGFAQNRLKQIMIDRGEIQPRQEL